MSELSWDEEYVTEAEPFDDVSRDRWTTFLPTNRMVHFDDTDPEIVNG